MGSDESDTTYPSCFWARFPLAIPVPGFRTMEQMQELVQARQSGPLPLDVMEAIAERVSLAGY